MVSVSILPKSSASMHELSLPQEKFIKAIITIIKYRKIETNLDNRLILKNNDVK